jgi:hypothetical protein
MRKGKTVAHKVGLYQPGYEELSGRTLASEIKEYESLNKAKKANGLNAKVMRRGESFPLTVEQALAEVRKAAVAPR